MQEISLFSRLSRKAGQKIYPGSHQDTHLLKIDRLIPVRPDYTEATAINQHRIAIEVERQTLREMTYKRLYPVVMLLSILCLIPPLASVGIDIGRMYQTQKKQQRQIFEQMQPDPFNRLYHNHE